MPILLSCPTCDSWLQREQHADGFVTCHQCRSLVAIPRADDSAAPNDRNNYPGLQVAARPYRPDPAPAVWCALLLVGVIGALALPSAMLPVTNPNVCMGELAVPALGMVVLVIAFVFCWWQTACPSCGEWFADIVCKREVLEQTKAHGLVPGTPRSSAFGVSGGTIGPVSSRCGQGVTVGSTSWNEREPVIRFKIELRHTCKHCQATLKETVEEEGKQQP
jgi:hypothetical protein